MFFILPSPLSADVGLYAGPLLVLVEPSSRQPLAHVELSSRPPLVRDGAVFPTLPVLSASASRRPRAFAPSAFLPSVSYAPSVSASPDASSACWLWLSLFGSIYVGLLSLSLFNFGQLFNLLLVAGILATGFLGAYKKNSIIAAAALILAAINVPFSISGFGIIGLFVTFLLALLTILANQKYNWLKEQEGFPYFNLRFTNQKLDQVQYSIKDPYTQKLEDLKKKDNNSGKMDEI